jgi:uncharacterized membrane protein (GlpM family)
VKAKFSVHTYFDSWNRIVIEGVLGGLMVSLNGVLKKTKQNYYISLSFSRFDIVVSKSKLCDAMYVNFIFLIP